jgi:hypothetical protein
MIVRNRDGAFGLVDWKRLSPVRRLNELGTDVSSVVWSPKKQLLVAFLRDPVRKKLSDLVDKQQKLSRSTRDVDAHAANMSPDFLAEQLRSLAQEERSLLRDTAEVRALLQGEDSAALDAAILDPVDRALAATAAQLDGGDPGKLAQRAQADVEAALSEVTDVLPGLPMQVWSPQGGIIATPQRPDKSVRDAEFAGELFLALDRHQNLSAWDTNTWRRADDRAGVWQTIFDDFRKQRPQFWGLQHFTLSPDERSVALWSGKGGVLWYSLHDGARLAAELVHREWPCSFAFAADGTIAASASTGSRVALWQTDPPEFIDMIRAGGQMVALSPDGSRLITARYWGMGGPTETIKLHDVATRRHLVSLVAHDREEVGVVADMVYLPFGNHQMGSLPDGNGIYAVTAEGLHVWKVPTLAEIGAANDARLSDR